jgi:hypothetical protein
MTACSEDGSIAAGGEALNAQDMMTGATTFDAPRVLH